MTKRHEVCAVEDLPPGSKTIVHLPDTSQSIGVFNVDGEFHALANICPHQLAPLCEGKITGEMVSKGPGEFEFIREGKIIQCPWHGWKFDIEDGTSVFNPHKVKTRTYEASVEPSSKNASSCEMEFGTPIEGKRPPVENYDTAVEDAIVVVYV